MSFKRLRSGMLLSAMMLALGPVCAQPVSAQSASGASAVASQPEAKSFSQQDLDRLLAPIALYPDALLAQIFMASTYPWFPALIDDYYTELSGAIASPPADWNAWFTATAAKLQVKADAELDK